MSKPRLLPLRVPSGRSKNRIPQLMLWQSALQHAHDLPIADAIQSGCVGRDSCREDPANLLPKTGAQHRIDPVREPPVQHFTRQREVNVPGPQRSTRAGLTLPPRKRVSGQQRHLDRARGPLAATPRKSGIEPSCPARECWPLQGLRPGPEPLATLGVERELMK